MCFVQAGVAALVQNGHRLNGELTVGQGGTEPDPPLVRWLYHRVAALCKGGDLWGVSLCRGVSPCDLLHLLRQPVGARKGGRLPAHRCLVALNGDLRCGWRHRTVLGFWDSCCHLRPWLPPCLTCSTPPTPYSLPPCVHAMCCSFLAPSSFSGSHELHHVFDLACFSLLSFFSFCLSMTIRPRIFLSFLPLIKASLL